MRDRSLSRDERRRQLSEIKERYRSINAEADANASASASDMVPEERTASRRNRAVVKTPPRKPRDDSEAATGDAPEIKEPLQQVEALQVGHDDAAPDLARKSEIEEPHQLVEVLQTGQGDAESDLSSKGRAVGRPNRAVTKNKARESAAGRSPSSWRKKSRDSEELHNPVDGSMVSAESQDMAFDNASHTNKAEEEPTSVALSNKPAASDSNVTNQRNPIEHIPTDRTPMKKIIRKLSEDDPSLTVLKLDGRKKIKPEDWEGRSIFLFDVSDFCQ